LVAGEETNIEAVQWTDLRTRHTFALAFADHVDRLVASDCAPGSPEGTKMLACFDPPLDRPMILFQNIVEVLHRYNGSIIGQGLGLFEQAEALLEFFFAARVMAIEEFARCDLTCSIFQRAVGELSRSIIVARRLKQKALNGHSDRSVG
jgi:hypothetical protein